MRMFASGALLCAPACLWALAEVFSGICVCVHSADARVLAPGINLSDVHGSGGPCLYGEGAVLECRAQAQSAGLPERLRACRPRGRSSIIIPAGGANCVAWAAFRDTLLRMEGASGQVLIEVRGQLARQGRPA